jgi:hypothetical protein
LARVKEKAVALYLTAASHFFALRADLRAPDDVLRRNKTWTADIVRWPSSQPDLMLLDRV